MLATENMLTAPHEVQKQRVAADVQRGRQFTKRPVRVWEAAKAAAADSDPSHIALPDRIRTRFLEAEEASMAVFQRLGIQIRSQVLKDLVCAANWMAGAEIAFDAFRSSRAKRQMPPRNRTPQRRRAPKGSVGHAWSKQYLSDSSFDAIWRRASQSYFLCIFVCDKFSA